jgi:flagellar biosynthesis/type III secretory pathway protein FliH
MTTDTQLAERLTAEHESCLETIIDGILEGIAEGAREGLAEGLKKGTRDALQECLFQGPDNIGTEDIKDIIQAIPQAIIKTSVIKGAKPILKQTAELYLKKACQKLIEELKEADIKPSPEQIGYILELIQKGQGEAVKQIVERLPKNPLFSALADGMQTALSESLGESLEDCRAKLQKELATK